MRVTGARSDRQLDDIWGSGVARRACWLPNIVELEHVSYRTGVVNL